jgi:integrase
LTRTIGRLTALKVEKAKQAGMYADGGGLYLRVTEDGNKSWVYRFMLNGRPRWMGLGPLALYGLQEARQKAVDARRLRHEGIDPIEARRAVRARERLDTAKAMTFSQCAEAYLTAHRAGWRNAKHAAQWEATLATYAEPIMGALPVQAIDTALVMKVLEPVWTEKPETASRLRGRIEAILNWARVRGYRSGENPARWRGHLDHLLPARSKVRKVEHHAALPYAALPGFLASLREQEGIAARALEFAILTAARTGEVLGARLDEIDTAEKVWTIPADRMKAHKEHRIPLSARALEILADVADGEQLYIFSGAKVGKPLSNMAFLMLLRRMKRADLTAHGFRSSFRDWAADRTNFPSEVAEMALAHTISGKVEAAYRRGDLFLKRRTLMDAWAQFCAGPTTNAKVVQISKPRPMTASPITHMHVGEAAQLLGKSRAELDRLIAAGQLPQPDRSGRLPAAVVDKLIAEQ